MAYIWTTDNLAGVISPDRLRMAIDQDTDFLIRQSKAGRLRLIYVFLMLIHPTAQKAFIEGYGVADFVRDWCESDPIYLTFEAVHPTATERATSPAGRLMALGPAALFPSHEELVFLWLTDNTKGTAHFVRVPPSMKTVQAALAWSFDLAPKDYHPDIET